eukprot:m.739987 g.739987  ORF g.739987 m.739987 type:complete len:1626 (-) comp58922_c0_seq2:1991-6868(-)
MVFWRQVRALIVKNRRIMLRSRRRLASIILLPALFVMIAGLIRMGVHNEDYPPQYTAPVVALADTQPSFTESQILYTPDTPATQSVLQAARGILETQGFDNITLIPFNSTTAMDNYYQNNANSIQSGIVFTSLNLLNFTIKMKEDPLNGDDSNLTFIPATNNFYSDNSDCRAANPGGSCLTADYLASGFVALQTALHLALVNATDASLDISLQQFPKFEFTIDAIASYQASLILFLTMAFSPIFQSLLIMVVSEKERGLKETLYLMGMSRGAYWTSWLLTYAAILLIPCVAMVVLIAVFKLIEHSNYILIFFLVYSYAFSLLGAALTVSTFFSNSRVAGSFGALFNSLSSVLIYALNGHTLAAGLQWILSLVPTLGLLLGYTSLFNLDQAGGANFGNAIQNGFGPGAAIIMLFLDAFLLTLLSIYLDAVLPSNGPSNPWNFCLPSFSTKSRDVELEGEEEPLIGTDYEPREETQANSVAVRISRVSKKFSLSGKKERQALSNVTLELCEGEIFALLGHNGAGKTTLHRIITGLLAPTSGKVSILGHNMNDARDRARVHRLMGICPQHDVLFEGLSVTEHFELLAELKDVPRSEVARKIQETIKLVDLDTQTATSAEALSGGQRRKLSVGLALIGDPKILVLDEPSTGMDPFSRRKLWTLLQSTRASRVVLLTTHFMDEADILSDRKAILTHGIVRCVGSSLFLKSRFGVGYNLNMVKSDRCDPGALGRFISHFTPSAQQIRNVGAEIVFQLPYKATSTFGGLFEGLNQRQGELGITSYGLSMTSLEEVFLSLQTDLDELNQTPDQDHVAHDAEIVAADQWQSTFRPSPASTFRKIKSLAWLNRKRVLRNPRALFFQIIVPCTLMIISVLVIAKPIVPISSNADLPSLLLTPNVYSAGQQLPYTTSGSPVSLVNSFINLMAKSVLLQGDYVTNVTSEYSSLGGQSGFLASCGNYSHAAGVEASAMSADDFNVTLLYNDTTTHSLPSYLSLLLNTVFPASAEQTVFVTSEPWAYSQGLSYDSSVFTTILLIAIALSVAPGGTAIDLVRDRKIRMKHQLFVAGVTSLEYWLAQFFCFLPLLAIPSVVALILVFATHLSALTGPATTVTILALVTYLPLTMMFSFAMSFLFDDPDTVQSTYPPIQNMISFIPYIAVGILDLSGNYNLARTLHFIFCCIDMPYTLPGCLYYIFRVQLVAAASVSPAPITSSDYFEMSNTVLPTLMIMWAQIVLLFLVIYFLDSGYKACHSRVSYAVQDAPANASHVALNMADGSADTHGESRAEDDDVVRERALAHSQQRDADSVFRLQHLTRIFSDGSVFGCSTPSRVKRAVDDLSFCVRSGEVFGLLGPNGAGKTTTIGILTGDLPATRGDAEIQGHFVSDNIRAILSFIGFCPQFSALWAEATMEEHLELFATLKGYTSEDGKRRSDFFSKQMKIQTYLSQRTKELSGGTQRKLSVALAMMGNPPVLLLDEPSSGMDPGSRRFLWNVISASVKNRAAILTTHAMEEAEALCHRLGIMVNGKLQCIGSPQHLKAKFGEGYVLEIRYAHGHQADIQAFVASYFPGAVLKESFGGRLSFTMNLQSASIGSVFATMENHRASLGIEDYMFNQPTLEGVFISFARRQIDPDR